MPLSLGFGLGLVHGGGGIAPPPATLAVYDFTTQTPGAGSLASYTGLNLTRATVGSSDTVRAGASTVATGIGANTPRFYSDGTRAGVKIEETRTNVIKDSRDMSTGNWVTGTWTSFTHPSSTGPDGSATAPSRTVVASSGSSNYSSPVGLAGNYVLSSWTKNTSGSGPIQIHASGGQEVFAGTASSPGTWTRLATPTLTPFGANINCFCVDGRNGSGSAGIAAGALDNVTDLAQLENGKFATEAIVTGAAAVTRPGERLYNSSASGLLAGGNQLRFYAQFYPSGNLADYANTLTLWYVDANNNVTIAPATGIVTVTVGGTAVATTTNPFAWSANDTMEVWIVAGNGAPVVEWRVNAGATKNCTMAAGSHGALSAATLDIFCNGTTNQLTAVIANVTAYNSGNAPAWVI